jgi:hypothetical protein
MTEVLQIAFVLVVFLVVYRVMTFIWDYYDNRD